VTKHWFKLAITWELNLELNFLSLGITVILCLVVWLLSSKTSHL